MRQVWVIGKNTYREIIRDRILYGLLVFALLLMGVSLALGELSFAEQTRISANFGLSGIQLSAVILSIFLGSTLVSREIEKKTIMTLLVRPLSRVEFILGKAVGLSLVTLTLVFGLALVLISVVGFLGMEINWILFGVLLGIFFEALVLLGVTVFFSSFATPMMTVIFSASVFLIGHWLDSLRFFADRSESLEFLVVSRMVNSIIPNLENYNWREAVIYSDPIPLSQVFWAGVNALSWFGLLILLTAFIFGRRDFA